MCTLGALTGRSLFKTRDLWKESDLHEEVVTGQGRLSYLGVRGHAAPGERGLNSGINEAGLAVAITFADSVPLAEALRHKTPRGVLVEEILASCPDLGSALHRAAEFAQQPMVGGNIVIMTPRGGAVLEQLYPLFCLEQVTGPVTVRTNHFINMQQLAPLRGSLENSLARYRRLEALLGDGEGLDSDGIRKLLADHGGEYPICSHQGELATVSAVIYDLTRPRLLYTPGPPCCTDWQEFRL